MNAEKFSLQNTLPDCPVLLFIRMSDKRTSNLETGEIDMGRLTRIEE